MEKPYHCNSNCTTSVGPNPQQPPSIVRTMWSKWPVQLALNPRANQDGIRTRHTTITLYSLHLGNPGIHNFIRTLCQNSFKNCKVNCQAVLETFAPTYRCNKSIKTNGNTITHENRPKTNGNFWPQEAHRTLLICSCTRALRFLRHIDPNAL